MFGRMMNSFYYGKSGKGDFKKEDLPKNRWQLFWEMLRVRISALCRLNLMTVIAWIPFIYIIGNTLMTFLQVTNAYENFKLMTDLSELTAEELAFYQTFDSTAFFRELCMYFCLWSIPCLLITGPVQAAMAYVTRNWARDEHAFIWSDFKDAFKANWKQGLGVSAITCVLPLIVYVCWTFYGQMSAQSALYIVPQMLTLVLACLWSLACVFLYPMMVTYRMRFPALIKNGFLLAIARLPMVVGARLGAAIPAIIAIIVFFFTGTVYALLFLVLYYALFGYAMTRFVFASFSNAVFDRFINKNIEGVEVNRGLSKEEDDEDEEETETDRTGHIGDQ